MKRFIPLLLALILSACSSGVVVDRSPLPEQPQTQQSIQQEEKPSTSHLCGATLKSGKLCTRKVSNGDYTDTAVEALCFQHRPKKETK